MRPITVKRGRGEQVGDRKVCQWDLNRNNRTDAYQAYRVASRGAPQIQVNAGNVIHRR